jgi:hypothetical protein
MRQVSNIAEPKDDGCLGKLRHNKGRGIFSLSSSTGHLSQMRMREVAIESLWVHKTVTVDQVALNRRRVRFAGIRCAAAAERPDATRSNRRVRNTFPRQTRAHRISGQHSPLPSMHASGR